MTEYYSVIFQVIYSISIEVSKTMKVLTTLKVFGISSTSNFNHTSFIVLVEKFTVLVIVIVNIWKSLLTNRYRIIQTL